MDFTPHGQHLIAGERVSDGATFRSHPASGAGFDVAEGSSAQVDAAVTAAESAFETYGQTSREVRAKLLERIADEIEARGAAITAIGTAETGLPVARLDGERGRTTGQLRLFASHIRDGAYLDRRHDTALPDRAPAPRPEMKMIELPIGPVAVFGASNFPLAFSTAGGDTASALAAGCPVVVKGHPAHPGTAEIVAEAIVAALTAEGLPPGVFSLVQGSSRAVGEALVDHPVIRAVGFTGSLGAGRALFDRCARRPEPIPFFGELGSVNPVFVLPAAQAARGEAIAKGWAASLTMGVGQFCTNPGLMILVGAAPDFTAQAVGALGDVAPQTMLTEGIAGAYRAGTSRIAGVAGVTAHGRGAAEGRLGAPALFEVSAADFIAEPQLSHENFGPSGLVIHAADLDEAEALARGLDGQLTCTLQMDDDDTRAAARLMPLLARKAGRVLVNGFPTGVEVSEAMVHGGPYPASTNFGATSVGTLAIRRWLRPVCFQNVPEALLPEDLRGL